MRPRIGLLSNPNSGRNRSLLPSLRNMLAAAGGVHHEVTPTESAIPEALARMAQAGVDVVAVNGGDGSVAHVLAVLLAPGSPFPTQPMLCALPGGTTNVTVGDVGIRGGLEESLMTLLAWRDGRVAGRTLERPVIGVRDAAGRLLGCGLVFGSGAVVDGIEYWHEAVRARGMRSEYSSGVAMLRTLWGMLRGHERFASPVRTRLEVAGQPPCEGDYVLLVVSALERLFLGIHPFWGESSGALRLTAIARGAPGFTRALPGILRGRAPRDAGNAYLSTRFDTARIAFSGGYTLDGEIHHVTPADCPLEVFDAGRARFLRI